MNIDLNVSRNFETAKVVAILIVACGHFLPPSPFWVVVSVALCLFSFASGYFTALIYGEKPDPLRFVRNKLIRLGPGLLVINLILLALFVVEGKDNIFVWQSLLGVLGLSGWLNWLHLPNPSPFGAGLWYFTLLLLFYVSYPLLARLLSRGLPGIVATFCLLIAALWLSEHIPYGHMLWLTAFCFCFGVAFANQQWKAGPKNTLQLGGGLILAFLLTRAFVTLPFSTLVVAFSALVVIQLLLTLRLPDGLHQIFKPLGACVLEIYFFHTYLFVHPTGSIALDLTLSLTIILAVSLAAEKIAGKLQSICPR